MRFRDGFSLNEIAELKSRFLNPTEAFETPDITRRFLFLEEPERASGGDSLVIVSKDSRLDIRASLSAGLILAEEGVEGLPTGIPVIRILAARPMLAALINGFYARVENVAPPEWPLIQAADENNVHPSAVVEGTLGGGVTVGAHAYIGAGSWIGHGTVIQPGVVIGSAGFGFFDAPGAALKREAMPHLAGVVIGVDCFIGANTVIAAGVLHPTEIGNGCKLDSHVQIAHNVRLGARSLMASQSGIAGSTVIGEEFRIGGAGSVAGHLRIGRNVSVAAKSGVTKDISDNSIVAGFPARPIAEWRRVQVALAKLERLGKGA